VSVVSIHIALLTAFIFTFLVPGLIFSRFFRLKSYEVLAFVPIFSVLVSTQLVYYLSLLFGYSRITILVSFFSLAVVYTLVNLRKEETYHFKNFLSAWQSRKTALALFLLIFILAFVILYRSVWFENETGIVITGSNWQDTPVHYEIIESINNGNFPPEMPYYSGERLNYHYFVDFHTAILEKVYGFLPKLLPISNAIFILIFALSIYCLARENGERAAVFATIIATLGWGFSYFTLFSALAYGQFNPSQSYMYQYGGFFGLPPIFDNLLQQRPLLIGLPAFAFALNLLRDMEDRNRLILAGIVTGLLFPFHVLSFFCVYIAYFISIVLVLRNFKVRHLYFLVSALVALPFFLSGTSSVSISLVALWAYGFLKDNPVLYYVMNLGIPFLISLAMFFTKVEKKFLKVVFIGLFLVPNLVSITPNPWDMYKFFIFSWIPIAVLSGAALARINKDTARVLLLLSILASASVVVYNLSTNYPGASWDEYNLGMWVRDNTEERAVFLTSSSIHSPPTMIGGRLRVLSYLNWPYGHGISLDDIWKRVYDVDRAYNGTENDLKEVVEIYNATYVYVGREELRNYPRCIAKFDSIEWLKLVYNGSLRIYKIVFQ